MSVNIIAYPPGGGGNHVRNLCDLDGRFHDQWPWSWVQEQRVGLQPYDSPVGVPGEVHSLPGRNLHEVFVDHVSCHPDRDYLLHAHFGELAPHADRIAQWPHVKWLIMNMDHDQDRRLLRARQHRLQYHPYWQDEEQIFLYQPRMYTQYFAADVNSICMMPLRWLWHRHCEASGVLEAIQQAFGITVPTVPAHRLHIKWCDLNLIHTQDLD